MGKLKTLTAGIIRENPVLVLVLGTCPTLAVSTSVKNAIGMGIAATFVLIGSNFVISLLKNVIPDKVRIPCYIVVIAGFVTVVQLLLNAFVPTLYSALGIFLPLIVVNCIILGRAEAFANKNGVVDSILDGIGMGLGFTIALTLAGLVRELLGAGTAFGFTVFPKEYAIGILIQPPGAFLVIALFIIIMNAIGIKTRQRQLVESDGCDGCCATCAMRCEDAKEETK